MADRQQRVPTGNIYCRWHKITGRWPQAVAGDVSGWPTRHPLSLTGNAQVFGAKPDTKPSSREILRQGARGRDLRELRTNTNTDDHRMFKR